MRVKQFMTEGNYQKLAKEWFSKADDDLLFAVAGFKETGIAADACFLSHQAIEKYLKGYLVANAVEPKRIHILPELLFDCVKINHEFLKLREDCEFLNGFYNPARYPGGMGLDFDKATGGKALHVAQEIINFIKLIINESKSINLGKEDGEYKKDSNGDFINIGTFEAGGAEILRKELEQKGVAVKIVYPGTKVGKESSGGAIFTAYTIFIQNSDLDIAHKLEEQLNIYPIKKGEAMPLPKNYVFSKKFPANFFLGGAILCSIVAVIVGNFYRVGESNLVGYFLLGAGLFLVLWFLNILVKLLKKKN